MYTAPTCAQIHGNRVRVLCVLPPQITTTCPPYPSPTLFYEIENINTSNPASWFLWSETTLSSPLIIDRTRETFGSLTVIKTIFFACPRTLSHRKLASTNKPVAFHSVHTGIEPPFLLKILLCDHYLHDSGLYIQKILAKREMINCQNFNILLFLTINSVTTAVRELNGTSQISLVTHDAKGEIREI